MPAVANPITFSPTSGQPITFADLRPKYNRGLPTRGIPSYGYTVGNKKPFRPGVGLTSGNRGTVSSGYTVPTYNVMENAGMNEYGSYDMPGTGDQIAEMLKGTIGQGLAMGGIGTLGAGLFGRNLTGLDLGSTPILGDIPGIGTGLKWLDYKIDPTWKNAREYAGGWGKGTAKFASDYPGTAFENVVKTVDPYVSGTIYDMVKGIPTLGASLAQSVGPMGAATLGASATGGGPASILYNQSGSPAMMKPGQEIKEFWNWIRGKPSAFGGTKVATPDQFVSGQTPDLGSGYSGTPEYSGISGFFNQPRSWIPGVSGTGSNATGFLGGGNPGQGITSIGNVLGTVGGLLSLADFIDDPSLASGLGTLAGAGASGISAFSGLATAAPWLAGAALVAGLLMNKKPSNKTGYTSIDLDEFKPLSFGMEGKKYSQENVDQTAQIMEPIIPLIQELEKQYGVDLKGDIQINYGGRDGLAYNIGNRDVTGFRNRLDYFDGRDQSTRDGGSIFRKTFKGENAGKDFYNSLLGDLETLAKQKQAKGGGVIDLSSYRGAQRQTPQGVFSYGIPGGGMIPTNMAGVTSPAVAQATTQPKGKQGVFSWGYGD